MLSYVLIFVIVTSARAQVFSGGRCNSNIPVVQNFRIESYMGKWFELERFFFIPEVLLKCSQANYTLNGDGTVKVINSGQYKLTGTRSSVEGVATIPDSSQPSKLEVRFSRFAPPGPYWILDTDYDQYSVVYSCTQPVSFIPVKAEVTWILTRTRDDLSADVKQNIYDMLNRNGINVGKLRRTDQTGCEEK